MSADTRRQGRAMPGRLWPLLLVLPALAATGPAEPAPDPELLEFLALWDADDEDWFDAALQQADGQPERRDEPAAAGVETKEAADDDAS